VAKGPVKDLREPRTRRACPLQGGAGRYNEKSRRKGAAKKESFLSNMKVLRLQVKLSGVNIVSYRRDPIPLQPISVV
jgi:hypothetical protein